jgi:hypothetical protein
MLQSAESTPTRTTPADHISQILFDTDDSLLNTGGEVSSEIEVFALHHSQLASDALNEGSEYPRFVFFPIGTDRGGPSTLHQLGDKSLLD